VGAAPVPDATLRTLRVLLAVAIAVSVVHYADNVANFADYPEPESGPAPSRTVIAIAWFAFTAAALAGYALLKRGHVTAAALCLAFYSGSGLVGLGHYTVPGATDMPWWRQAHVILDILCGAAVLVFAIALIRRRHAGTTSTPAG
jgi:hypothetical protein